MAGVEDRVTASVDTTTAPGRASAEGTGDGEPTPTVALLAATALGLAYTTGLTRRSVTLLCELAEGDPGHLWQASTQALRLEVTSPAPRQLAAELLERAALTCLGHVAARP